MDNSPPIRMTGKGLEFSNNLDNDEGMDSSSCLETTHTDPVLLTHPAVLIVFRTDNILEEICSYLDFDHLKQFRLASRACNSEGRRALIKQGRHWVVVKSGNDDDWEVGLGHVLTNLEKATSADGENPHQQSLGGWVFKRLETFWEPSLGHSDFLLQWGHYLKTIYVKAVQTHDLSISNCITSIHELLTVCCPNLEEMVAEVGNFNYGSLFSGDMNELESLEFPSPLLKLKCLRIKRLHMAIITDGEMGVVQRFITKLVRAAGTALEIFEIGYHNYWREMEGKMLESLIALNEGVSNFQSLKEMSLESAVNVAKLTQTVQKCFPKLIKLILRYFYSTPIVGIRWEAFPALKSLQIHCIRRDNITSGRLLYFLQCFPNLEVLTISMSEKGSDGLPVVPVPFVPLSKSLRSFTFNTCFYNLTLLRYAVNMFPNLTTLNLLGFGRECSVSYETEYSFGELMDIISPLSGLRHLYVNHAFHSTPQLADAIQLTSYFTALETIILSQAAYNEIRHFNVSLYLSSLDPEFLCILDCDWVRSLKSVQLLGFRYGTTQEDVEKEAAAKGGHVFFGPLCPCYLKPWVCGSGLKPCHNSKHIHTF